MISRMVSIPGTTAVADIRNSGTDWWWYDLYDENGSNIGHDCLNLNGLTVTPKQVARIAFILEVDAA